MELLDLLDSMANSQTNEEVGCQKEEATVDENRPGTGSLLIISNETFLSFYFRFRIGK